MFAPKRILVSVVPASAHLFLGSVADRVDRTAPCPVLTVR
jgi:nucleotide-binding universal stress UspA family protein